MQQLDTFEADESSGCGRDASVHHVYPVSRKAREERAECPKAGGYELELRHRWLER